jgi:hypothetical protein
LPLSITTGEVIVITNIFTHVSQAPKGILIKKKL